MSYPTTVDKLAILGAVQGTPAETVVRALLHRCEELEEAKPLPHLMKEQVEDAVSSLFITAGGGEATQMRRQTADGYPVTGSKDDILGLPEAVSLVCHHLGVKE